MHMATRRQTKTWRGGNEGRGDGCNRPPRTAPRKGRKAARRAPARAALHDGRRRHGKDPAARAREADGLRARRARADGPPAASARELPRTARQRPIMQQPPRTAVYYLQAGAPWFGGHARQRNCGARPLTGPRGLMTRGLRASVVDVLGRAELPCAIRNHGLVEFLIRFQSSLAPNMAALPPAPPPEVCVPFRPRCCVAHAQLAPHAHTFSPP